MKKTNEKKLLKSIKVFIYLLRGTTSNHVDFKRLEYNINNFSQNTNLETGYSWVLPYIDLYACLNQFQVDIKIYYLNENIHTKTLSLLCSNFRPLGLCQETNIWIYVVSYISIV